MKKLQNKNAIKEETYNKLWPVKPHKNGLPPFKLILSAINKLAKFTVRYLLKPGTTWNDLKRARNDLTDLQRARNDLKWPTTSKKRPEMTYNEQETIYNEQETTWNDLQRARNDMKRPTRTLKDLQRTRNDLKQPTTSKTQPLMTWTYLQRSKKRCETTRNKFIFQFTLQYGANGFLLQYIFHPTFGCNHLSISSWRIMVIA